jgi:hypothetical protein
MALYLYLLYLSVGEFSKFDVARPMPCWMKLASPKDADRYRLTRWHSNQSCWDAAWAPDWR